jgi:4-cresol dehydrogenase (hydroxylating)
MTQARTQPGALEDACRDWRALLGADAVLRDPDVLARSGRTTLPDAPSPVAVLRPRAVEQVAPAVRVAAAHRVPLYPISRGKNWGWGDACPVTAGQAVLDLSALDRIVAVDEELGYAVVQPGVTQGQLADHLRATGSAWWLDPTAAGPDTSVLGNILERGATRDERVAQVCGMAVVLADGTEVRTGFGHYPGSRVTHVARWGVGPSLDGLFSQSNLAVVTELGFWLPPRPAHAELGYYAVPDEGIEAAIDALRPLRIRGVIPGQPLQLAPAGDRPVWLGITTLQGHPQAVAAHREELTAALAPAAKVAFPRPEEAADPAARAAILAALGLPANPFFDNILRRADPLGAPRMAPEGLLAWLGGPAVQQPTGPPTSSDPLDHDYGFYFAWPTCPALGREVRALLDLVRPILAAHDCPQLLALRFVTGRAINLVMRIAFDRKREDRRTAARACHRTIVETTLAAGYPPARMAIDGMDRLDPAGDTFWHLVRRLKRCLDPDGILAPGRYLPPAPGQGPAR